MKKMSKKQWNTYLEGENLRAEIKSLQEALNEKKEAIEKAFKEAHVRNLLTPTGQKLKKVKKTVPPFENSGYSYIIYELVEQ